MTSARVAAAVLLIALARLAAADPVTPNHVSVVVDEEIGVLSTTHTMLTGSYARRLWCDRAYVEARLGFGAASSLAVVETRAAVGLVFHPSERVDLLIGWRFGDSYFRGHLNAAPYSVHLVAAELAIELAVKVTPRWRLRALPLAPTVLWNKTYGATVGLELGADVSF